MNNFLSTPEDSSRLPHPHQKGEIGRLQAGRQAGRSSGRGRQAGGRQAGRQANYPTIRQGRSRLFSFSGSDLR
jgi:hypothetical protein